MGEIKKFADEVIPKSRFIFDKYKIDPAPKSTEDQENDYFSFFGSHEQAILKPESNFKNLYELMTYLPIDYYILLQRGYDKKLSKSKMFKKSNQRTNLVMFNGLPVLD